MMTEPIDLDGLATTRIDPLARSAMMDAWSSPGNPGSAHAAGERSADIVERGRQAVAELVGAAPAEIILTSGATEADNLAVTGTALAALERGDPRRGIVVSTIEHKAVLEPAMRLRALGFDVRVAPVTRSGAIDLGALGASLDAETLLVSVMAANNETGAMQPVGEAARLAHAAGALFHTDAAQAAGKVEVDLGEWGVDYASLSSHKLHGPMGVGALYVAAHAPPPAALIVGGGQERGLRSGTVPAPLVAGFGAAAVRVGTRLAQDSRRAERLLSVLLERLAAHGIEHELNTRDTPRLPGAASVRLPGVDADSLVQTLARKVYLSTGSACSSGQIRPSHVLAAMGLADDEIAESVRFYCDPTTTEDEIERAATAIGSSIKRLLAAGRTVQ